MQLSLNPQTASIPPAALAVHLSIGQAYAWSNLKTGLGTGPGNLGFSGTATALPFQLAIVMLGLSAACVAPVAQLPFASIEVATEPNETAMLELL